MADLDKLLAEIVSELVCHDLGQDVHHRKKKASYEEVRTRKLVLAFFQLFLDHSAAGLVERENINLPDDVNFVWGKVPEVRDGLDGHRGAIGSLLRGKLG